MLWDLAEGKRLYSLDAGDIIYALTFSPNRYWLCAATQTCIKIWCAAGMGLCRRNRRCHVLASWPYNVCRDANAAPFSACHKS